MDKYLSCWSVTEKCYFVVQGESEEEVLREIAEHEEKVHEIKFTDDLKEKAKSVMRLAS